MNDFRAAPNQLTFLRLCLVPFLVLAILDGHYRTATAVFVVAGVTDGLDGLLARLLHQRTVLGQYLDPVADKLLLSTLFLVLNHEGLISRRVTVLVFGRDLGILVVSAILYISIGMRDFRPSIYGKANTLAQIIALSMVLVGQFYAPGYIVSIPNRIAERDDGADRDFRISLCLAGGKKTQRDGKRRGSATLRIRARRDSVLLKLFLLAFDLHIAKLTGLENLAAFLAFDVLRVLVSRDNSHFRVRARRVHGVVFRRMEFGEIVSAIGRSGKAFSRPSARNRFTCRRGWPKGRRHCKPDTFGRIL